VVVILVHRMLTVSVLVSRYVSPFIQSPPLSLSFSLVLSLTHQQRVYELHIPSLLYQMRR
jgi:hypothetical protein